MFVAELDQERIITRSFVVICFTLAPPCYRPYVRDGARPFLTKYEHIMVHFLPLVHHLEANLCVVLVYAYDLVTKWLYASQNPIDCTLNLCAMANAIRSAKDGNYWTFNELLACKYSGRSVQPDVSLIRPSPTFL